MNKVINIKSMARIILVLSLILYPLLAWSQDPWTIRTDQPLQGDYYGITSANGQIGLVSSRHPLQVDKVVVGGLYDIYGSGRLSGTRWRLVTVRSMSARAMRRMSVRKP